MRNIVKGDSKRRLTRSKSITCLYQKVLTTKDVEYTKQRRGVILKETNDGYLKLEKKKSNCISIKYQNR